MVKTDPICGKRGIIEAYGHYFCGKECISVYEEKYNIKRERGYITGAKSEKWYREKTFLVILGLIVIKALFVIISAIIIAIVTGLIYQFLDKKGLIESNENVVEINNDFLILKDIKKRWKEHRFSLVNVKNGVIVTI